MFTPSALRLVSVGLASLKLAVIVCPFLVWVTLLVSPGLAPLTYPALSFTMSDWITSSFESAG